SGPERCHRSSLKPCCTYWSRLACVRTLIGFQKARRSRWRQRHPLKVRPPIIEASAAVAVLKTLDVFQLQFHLFNTSSHEFVFLSVMVALWSVALSPVVILILPGVISTAMTCKPAACATARAVSRSRFRKFDGPCDMHEHLHWTFYDRFLAVRFL